MKRIATIFLLAIIAPHISFAGSAQDFNVRVIECISAKALKTLRKDALEGLETHIACGQDKAAMLLQSKHHIRAGKTQSAQNLKTIPFLSHVERIDETSKGFSLSPERFIDKKQAGTELKFKFIGVDKEGLAKVSVTATTTEWKSREKVAWFNEDKVYVNTEPVKKQRVIVATGLIKPNEGEILAGDVWLNAPATEETLKRLPEQARLWLELRWVKP